MVDPNPARGMPLQLQRYWLIGKGAAKIRWGVPGDFLRCVRNLRKYFPKEPEGLCNILHRKALGVAPGQEHKHSIIAAADVHTGAMVALIPSEADAKRIAVKGGEAAEQLHVTLAFLGNAKNISPEDQQYIAALMRVAFKGIPPAKVEAFNVSMFNPQNKEKDPCIVLGFSGEMLESIHHRAWNGLASSTLELPEQHMPWVPHMTLIYTDDMSKAAELTDRTGPITLDRIRVAFGGENTDIPLDGEGYDEARSLLAAMPVLGKELWAGPLAPIGCPTGEPNIARIFESGSVHNRPLPLPLDYRKVRATGHEGSVTVGRILGITTGPDDKGMDYVWGWGDWLSEDIVPEVKEAKYVTQQQVVGPSLDPGGKTIATINPETGAQHMVEFTIGGATLVPIPAFSMPKLYIFTDEEGWPDDDPDMVAALEDDNDCGCSGGLNSNLGETEAFTVNPSGWRGLPLAPRDAVFDNDDAVKRIQAWAGVTATGADVAKLRRAFMWRDPQQPETATTSYRLPVGDIINGRLTLIYHAVYAAAALISGAHGGLPGVSDEDKAALRGVISDIYAVMAAEFNDSSVRAPWDRSAQEGVQLTMTSFDPANFFAVDPKKPYGDVPYADPGYQDDGVARYPLDTERHCRAAWTYINQEDNASKYTPKQLKLVRGRIIAALKKYGVQVSEDASGKQVVAASMTTDAGYPVAPPREWFNPPALEERTPLTVTASGQVYGHLAAWNECHRDVTNRECVLAPKSALDYKPFHLGSVVTEEGDVVKVGKITMDTRHANINLPYASAALHYDNTGDEVAVVRAGEDQFGIWVAGAVVPEADQKKVAKLRRSPLSGDWRTVYGNLELAAALAVNFPAFPVYSMQGEDRLALVAAGTVELDLFYEEPEPTEPEFDEEQDNRGWRLRELLDEDETLAQQARARRLEAVFAMDPTAKPVTTAKPAPAPEGDPYSPQATLARQMDAQFSIVEEPEGGGENLTQEEKAAGVPVTPVVR